MTGERADVERVRIDDLDGTPHAALFARDEPRVIRLRLEAGESVPEHDHPDANVVIVALAGELAVHLDGERYALSGGDALRFDGERSVEPRAIEDTTALVTLASKG